MKTGTILEEAEYILEHGATIRETANYFGRSKSTVHRDMDIRLWFIDISLYFKVKTQLNKNKIEGRKKGGTAAMTKMWRNKREQR